MKLATGLANPPELSTLIDSTKSFTIQSTAHSFKILSNSLYGNKVKAIIRELSTNALDSHIAANNEKPFDVHLPSTLAPYFQIRDYGTGLSHEEVMNLYTTYFRSTKTESNEFIGALGLGSKSPFSYTTNFTITSVKNGEKGIYTAYINDQGVPSIAVMSRDVTDEENGVAIQFAVHDSDFRRFYDEAHNVYYHFQHKPNIANFNFSTKEYIQKDIIPGAHITKDGGLVAIMGNIAYPIDIPKSNDFEEVKDLLYSCNIEMHFDIGEIEFQPSREGLSYTELTLNSIKRKLIEFNNALYDQLKSEVDNISNLWQKIFALNEKRYHRIWIPAVQKYISQHNVPQFNSQEFLLSEKDLADKFNIKIVGWNYSYSGFKTLRPRVRYHYSPQPPEWLIGIKESNYFVINDAKIGCTANLKKHVKDNLNYHSNFFILNRADTSKPILVDAFFDLILSPPDELKILSSILPKIQKKKPSTEKPVIDVKELVKHLGCEATWQYKGTLSQFNNKDTYYYFTLRNGVVDGRLNYSKYMLYDALLLQNTIYGISCQHTKKLGSNWVDIEEYFIEKLSTLTEAEYAKYMVASSIEYSRLHEILYAVERVQKNISKDSLFLKGVEIYNTYDDIYKNDRLRNFVKNCYTWYNIKTPVDNTTKDVLQLINSIFKKYSLLIYLKSSTPIQHLTDYINLIDRT